MGVKKWKIAVPQIVIAWALGAGGVFLYMRSTSNHAVPVTRVRTVGDVNACAYSIKRLDGFQHIRPLIYAEPACESKRFAELKGRLTSAIATATQAGHITDAAIYVREFKKGEWLAVNGHAQFDPGSMMKVPTMITLLKMAERDPALFTKRLGRTRTLDLMTAYPPSKDIEPGKLYPMLEMLKYSIEESSNNAEASLLEQVNVNEYRDLCTSLGLPDFPATGATSYPLSVQQYAQFFKALYNSSFLSPLNSDLAMEMLVRADFVDGLRRGVPGNVEIAHKFGEAGVVGAHQLHDAGIVYAEEQPYLIVVMTRGSEMPGLAQTIGELSGLVYEHMSAAGN